MKKSVLFVIATLVMSSAVPVFATQKDECLLASKNCKDQTDSIQQKIQKLQHAIKQGKKVYTPAELKKLQDKLNETNQLLDDMLKGGR